jgi:hypothetical protein
MSWAPESLMHAAPASPGRGFLAPRDLSVKQSAEGSLARWRGRQGGSGAMRHRGTRRAPVKISFAFNDGPFNTYIFLGTGPDGTLYISYSSFPNSQKGEADI